MNAKAPTKAFHSPTGEELRITHGNGSVALIGSEPKPLPQHLWTAAIRAGAQPVGNQPKLTAAELKAATAAAATGAGSAGTDGNVSFIERLKVEIRKAVEAENDAVDSGGDVTEEFKNAFTSNGIPQVKWLQDRVGSAVSADQRDEAWAEVEAELEPEGDEDGEDEESGE